MIIKLKIQFIYKYIKYVTYLSFPINEQINGAFSAKAERTCWDVSWTKSFNIGICDFIIVSTLINLKYSNYDVWSK